MLISHSVQRIKRHHSVVSVQSYITVFGMTCQNVKETPVKQTATPTNNSSMSGKGLLEERLSGEGKKQQC